MSKIVVLILYSSGCGLRSSFTDVARKGEILLCLIYIRDSRA